MNTTCGFSDRSLAMELDLARARVAMLEKQLSITTADEKAVLEDKCYWSHIYHYLGLADNIDQGVLVLDRKLQIIFVNTSALQLLGCERDSLNAQNLFQSVSTFGQQQIGDLFSECKESGDIRSLVCECVLASGKTIVLRLKFIPVFGTDNKCDGIQIIISDVSEEHRIRSALKRSEMMYQALFDGAGDSIFIHDSDGNFIDANNIACERLGYSREELLQLTPDDIRVGDSSPVTRVPSQKGSFELQFAEVEHVTKEGENFSVEVNSRTVDFNGDTKVLTIARDISERVAADKLALLHRKRLKALYEMAHMNESSTTAFLDFAIRKSIDLTQSEFGFIALLEGSGSSASFSNWISYDRAGNAGAVPEPEDLKACGLWNDVVTNRKAVLNNDLDSGVCMHPFTDGGVRKFLALPVVEAGAVVVVAVLVNKEDKYDSEGVRNLSLLLEGMWNILCKKESEQRVRNSLREKETLLKEVHHRVKNNMQVICSLLNLQTDYINDPQDLTLIKHSIDRVRSMAYVHEQLYRSDDLSSIDFDRYISGLGRTLVSTYGVAGKVQFTTSLDPVKLPIEQALPCGLIVNELITNAITHAFPESSVDEDNNVSVELALDGDIVSMTVADNGIGFDNGLERSGSLGHVLIDTLTQQIDGTMESFSENGARFNLNFRLK